MIRWTLLLVFCTLAPSCISPLLADFTLSPSEVRFMTTLQVVGDGALYGELPTNDYPDGIPQGGMYGAIVGLLPNYSESPFFGILIGAFFEGGVEFNATNQGPFSLVVHNDYFDPFLAGLYVEDVFGNKFITPRDQLISIPADGPPGQGHLISLDLTNSGDVDLSRLGRAGGFVATTKGAFIHVSYSSAPEVVLPEPSSLALFTLGSTGIFGLLRRRKRSTLS